MNFSGKFQFSGTAATLDPSGGTDDSVATGGHAVIVPDAHLLFSGDYKRAGVDLVLSKDGHDYVVPGYFKGSERATLASPDGASLSGSLVNALTGEVQVAQLGGGGAAAQVIGTVTKLTGSATAIRNGVSVQLNVGDKVNKGDVVEAGADSKLGITFIDGTVFGLSSNARMVLNEMVYDPNGSNNSSLLSLVQGTISFVAGETAKNGNMKVDTPVATMGIRGTAVLVEIDFTVPGQGGAPPVKFQVLVEPGGQVGSYVLYSKSNPNVIIGTVNQAGQITSVTGDGNSTTAPGPLSPEALAIIPQIFQLYFPNYTPNPNPQGTSPNNGSAPANPTPGGTNPDPIKFTPSPELPVNVPTPIPVNLPNDPPGTPPIIVTVTRFNAAPTIIVTPVALTATPGTNAFNLADQVTITDPNINDGVFNDVAVPYVAGSGRVLSATGPAGGPAGPDLNGLVTVDPQTGAVSYDPAAFQFLGAGQKAVFTIVFDSRSGPDTVRETLTFTINGVNDAPAVAAALTATADEGDALVTADLLAGATDPDAGETVTLAVTNIRYKVGNGPVSAAAPAGITLTGATLKVDPTDPAFDYLAAGQTLAIVVTYDVIDAHGATVPQSETITITGSNDAPVITGTSIEVAPGGIVLLNESSFTIVDPDNTSFTFTVTNVVGGTFQVWDGQNWVPSTESGQVFRSIATASPGVTFTTADLHDGHVRFVSDGSTASPTFSVQADDGGASNSSSAVFDATVEPGLNHAPQVSAVTLDALAEDTTRILTEAELLAQATDIDGQTLHVQNLHIASGGGTLCDNGDGTWSYTPARNYSGPVKFAYDVSDGIASVANTASVAVTPVNDAPVLVAAPLLVLEGGTVVLNALNFIVYDPDSSSYTFTVSNVTHGAFQIKDGGTWVRTSSFTTADINAGHVRFVHDGGEGAPTFSVQANDGAAANSVSNTAHGPVIYIPVNDAPTITSASFAVSEGGTVVLHRSDFGVSDPDSSNFKFTASGVTHGRFQTYSHGHWSNDNTFTTADLDQGLVRFVHDGSEFAPSFSIKADDGSVFNHVSGTVAGTVQFTNVNDAPDTVFHLTSTAGTSIDVSGYGATNGFVLPGAGNVTTPGEPEDRIVLGYHIGQGGNPIVVNGSPLMHDNDFTPQSHSPVQNQDGSNSVVVSLGAGNGVTLTQTITLGADANYFTTTIDIFNQSGATIDNVRFMRNFDPDQDVGMYNNYYTRNDVIHNPTPGADDVAIVSAKGGSSGAEVALIGLGGDWRASSFGFTNTNPYDPQAYASPTDPNGASDDRAIALTNDFGAIENGKHATVTYITTNNVATSGSNALYGTDGADTINGLGGNDLLIGLGGADTFVFSANSGHDTIYDFQAGTDQINLSAVVATDNLSAWMAAHVAASPNATSDTLITLDAGNTILLHNVAYTSLHTSDFIVHA